jgi:hypothetical protein
MLDSDLAAPTYTLDGLLIKIQEKHKAIGLEVRGSCEGSWKGATIPYDV